jgi:hypothetical protein
MIQDGQLATDVTEYAVFLLWASPTQSISSGSTDLAHPRQGMTNDTDNR